ncbi:MAG TPA: glycosyltransferase family 39 protein, partial [Anaerolineales bacterium]|nr:glycosyltransferase family 39 protein [Anaerolineales bacterium]
MLDVFRPIFSWDYTKKYWLAGVILIAMLCLSPIFHAYFNGNLIFKSDGGAWAIASNLVGGKGYSGCATDYFPNCESTSQATAMREPIPVLLIALARLFHPTKLSALIMQSLYYLGSIPAIYLTLKESSRNVKTALLGTLMWTFSVPVINQVDNGSGDLAAAFFFSFGMYFFLRGYHASKAKDWVISGLFFGLAALSRTVLLGVGIGLGAVMLAKKWFETRPFSKKQIGGILLFLV